MWLITVITTPDILNKACPVLMTHLSMKVKLNLVYTEFILVRLCTKLQAYIHTFEFVPWTNQYWVIIAQGNNNLPLMGFEPMRLLIIRLLVRCVNYSSMPPLKVHLILNIERIILFTADCEAKLIVWSEFLTMLYVNGNFHKQVRLYNLYYLCFNP
jgi:hypothetical protein